jgi:hypothetical protein
MPKGYFFVEIDITDPFVEIEIADPAAYGIESSNVMARPCSPRANLGMSVLITPGATALV